jgi:protein TonB
MRTDVKAFIVSCCLHLLVGGCVVSFAAFPIKQQTPILVDFTIEEEPHLDMLGRSGNPGASSLPAAPGHQSSRHEQPLVVTEPHETLQVARTEVMSVAPETVPVPAAFSKPHAGPVAAVDTTSGGGTSASASALSGQGGKGTTNGSGADIFGKGSGSRGESAEALRERYLKKHFGYIRDLINGNLRYPGRAIRMGWSGALKVEFVVRENGSIDVIRVVKSSGVPLLDSDAVETVRRSAPFPKPPVSARLIIPVEYVLE